MTNGVSVDAPDDAVRAQPALPDGQGVVVSEVVSGSPAEKAGVKKHDIVLELGGKPIDNPQTVARLVQAAQDKPTMLKLLRAGKPLTVPVTGSVRQVETNRPQEAFRLWMVDQSSGTRPIHGLQLTAPLGLQLTAPAGAEDLGQRLDHVEKELQALRAAVDKLNETLRADKAPKRD